MRLPVDIHVYIPTYLQKILKKAVRNIVAHSHLSLYGTRDAAHNWTAQHTQHLKSIGIQVGLSSLSNFHHDACELSLTVHGDGFLVRGPDINMQWVKRIDNKYQLKCSQIGPRADEKKDLTILNRIAR